MELRGKDQLGKRKGGEQGKITTYRFCEKFCFEGGWRDGTGVGLRPADFAAFCFALFSFILKQLLLSDVILLVQKEKLMLREIQDNYERKSLREDGICSL